MRVKFSLEQQNRFLNLLNSKNSPWNIETSFYKKTYKYINYIKWIPWLQMIGIWNSISMNSANKKSDIDLFIVTSDNALWFVRITITFIFAILRVRKTANKHAGRFCLSFFVTKSGINFNKWKIENDVYLYFWIVYFKPLLDYNNTYSLFLKENSKWAEFSNYEDIIKDNFNYIKYEKEKKEPWIIINKLNKFFKSIFLPKTSNHYKKLWKPYWIIINDNILKFHNWDIRKAISETIIIKE